LGSTSALRRCSSFLRAFRPSPVLENLPLDQVRLRNHYHTLADVNQLADVKVLPGLGFDGFIGCHNQQHQVDASHACQHVLHEPLMAGHVNEAYPQVVTEVQMSETQVDRDPSPFFFFEPIGIRTCQGLHERRFTVVYVTCCSYDGVFH
jgi:hypothetical protein